MDLEVNNSYFYIIKLIETKVMTFKLQYTNCILLSEKFCTFFSGGPDSIIKYGPPSPFSMGSMFYMTLVLVEQ